MAGNNERKITEEIYHVVKTLIEHGDRHKDIARYMGISAGSVSNIKHTTDYEAYKASTYHPYRKAAGEGTNGRRLPQPASVLQDAAENRMDAQGLLQEAQKMTELLAHISRKLDRIADDLCGAAGEKVG